MILSKQSIEQALADGEISIQPFTPEHLKEASYSFTLTDNLTLKPGEFVQTETKEHLKLSAHFACLLSTRGRWGLVGIDALQTDYFCEPDTDNIIKLGIKNNSTSAIHIPSSEPFVKAIFVRVE